MKACYGQFVPGADSHCKCCRYRGYCRRAKRDDRIQSDFCGAGEFVELLPAAEPVDSVEEVQDPERVYSYGEMVHLTRFFLDLGLVQFTILALRINRPDLSMNEIAAKVKCSCSMVSRFLRDISKAHPALEPLIYQQITRK